MGSALLHFASGTLGSLIVFLGFQLLSGGSFSAPFGVVFIGIACAALGSFVSPWATPAVLVAYALMNAAEFHRDRKDRNAGGSRRNS